MPHKDGGFEGRWKDTAADLGRWAAVARRAAEDAILPPLDPADPRASAVSGLPTDAWSRIRFLEAPVCDGCGAPFEMQGGDYADDRCMACQVKPYRFGRCRAACIYDEHSRGPILAFKHGDQQPLAPLFARWIGRAAADLIDQADAVVPTPLHRWRLLSRRFNQAAEIARPLAREARRDYLPDALARIADTASQGSKSARGRRLNVKDAFVVTPRGRMKVRGRRILLIDDVLTTGATADACAKALLEAGARSVDLAVIARVRAARDVTT